jgi:hypothetical protein
MKSQITTSKTNMTLQQKINDYLEDESILLADGFDEAFIGVARQFTNIFAVYDREKCIEILTANGITEDEAEEYFQFNVEGAYVGESTPAFLKRLS